MDESATDSALSPEDREHLELLFERAAELSHEEHAAFIERECTSNGPLRDELARLLRGLGGTDILGRLQPSAPSRAGTRIGPYELLEKIGEGGMGEVYAAEQKEPLVRRVALKIIKPGMDSAQVVARFGAERQALARMSHPNIAQAFDGGATEDGRPYFVMEYVGGEPLTGYCDHHRLATEARLELFLGICSGVQHAHQKGIIHRDLKPSNLLVMLQDGRAVPKIIDFGVARATTGRLAEHTLHTMLGQVVGTLDYMSPEQADPTGVDLDTRSDIYSLGVVLYQLVSGLLPFHHQATAGLPFSEVQRAIREQDPPTPSTRLRRLTGTLTTIAPLHGTNERALIRKLTGDLDWICLKALEKDPARRYQSVHELSEDVRRHLANEPVLAGRPGALYRARKFLLRHRVGVTTGSLVVAVGIAGLIGVVSNRLEANAKAAEVRRLSEFRGIEQQLREVERLSAQVDELWPAAPATIPDLESWISEARSLTSHLGEHRATLRELRALAEPASEAELARDVETHPRAEELALTSASHDNLVAQLERMTSVDGSKITEKRIARTILFEERLTRLEAELDELTHVVHERRRWRFGDPGATWLHENLSTLIDRLKQLDSTLLAPDWADAERGWSVPRRLAFAQTIEPRSISGAAAARAWAAAIASIADREECPVYAGLEIAPQLGLLPIGRDPASGLWEFAHLMSGEPAVRGADGVLVRDGETGVVLVLLPAGSFVMGAAGSESGEDHDSDVSIFEVPSHPVRLPAFFISKFELTQGQWQRATGGNPSNAQGLLVKHSPLKPVNNVSWLQCGATTGRLGLALPDEEQWEYAARAGTTSIWWTGNAEASLEGAENMLDESCDDLFPEQKWRGRLIPVAWDDGHPTIAEVGSLDPNPWGLYDVLGNAAEWCANHPYAYPRNGADVESGPGGRVARGGNSRMDARAGRCSSRLVGPPEFFDPALGTRPARDLQE